MADPRATPTAVRSPYKATTTEIDWADGHKGIYPHEILRGYCPCAGCQGHGIEIKFIPGGDITIKTIEPVGDYALALEWGDGHNTGIYTFRYLRDLCRCSQCVPPERQADRSPRAR
ncbi:MAG: gamma-butyrobetaine hydroxylase-like domain-containing protein [Polyangiales bacterium]